MCNKRSSVIGYTIDPKKGKTHKIRVDECIRDLIISLTVHGYKTHGSCCGHGKYMPSVICGSRGRLFELISGKDMPRTRNFYRKDDEGFYFIPEVEDGYR